MPGITIKKPVTKRKKQYTEYKGFDDQGSYSVEIQNDLSQIRFKTGNEEGYIDMNREELTGLRDAINSVLELKVKKRAKR